MSWTVAYRSRSAKPMVGACTFSSRRSPGPALRNPCTVPIGAATNPPAQPPHVPVDSELGLAFEDVEAVGVICAGVQVDSLEVGAEVQLDHLQRRQLAKNPVLPALATRQPLAAIGLDRDPAHQDHLLGGRPRLGRRSG